MILTSLRSLSFLVLLLAPVAAFASGRNSGAPVSADYVTILENRLAALEQQVQTLTNQAEQANYQARIAQERLQRLEEDLNTRFRMLESNAGAASAAVTQNSQTSAPPPTLGQMTSPSGNNSNTLGSSGAAPVMPDDQNVAYDQAFSKIRDGD